jgi:hypothetical protein
LTGAGCQRQAGLDPQKNQENSAAAEHEVKPAGALLDKPQLQFAPVERVAAIAGLPGK